MTPRSLVELLVARWRQRARPRYEGSRGVGQEWERLAEKHLKSAGYEILERNFTTRVGEIDFVAKEAGTLCFVEVKGRRSPAFGEPREAVTREKQRRIFRSAEAYLVRHRIGATPCRFDVVAILGSGPGAEVSILRDAFRGPVSARLRR
jgi:putative endonuclease